VPSDASSGTSFPTEASDDQVDEVPPATDTRPPAESPESAEDAAETSGQDDDSSEEPTAAAPVESARSESGAERGDDPATEDNETHATSERDDPVSDVAQDAGSEGDHRSLDQIDRDLGEVDQRMRDAGYIDDRGRLTGAARDSDEARELAAERRDLLAEGVESGDFTVPEDRTPTSYLLRIRTRHRNEERPPRRGVRSRRRKQGNHDRINRGRELARREGDVGSGRSNPASRIERSGHAEGRGSGSVGASTPMG